MNHDSHFKQFTADLQLAIDKHGQYEGDFLDRQRKQVEALLALETKFRKKLIRHKWGAAAYRDFIAFICDERKNILAARPFFRERQEIFTAEISKALKARAEKTLFQFHINYQFIAFIIKTRKWGKNSELREIAEQIKDLRTELVELNMPLVINRARIFWSRTPKSHLTFMDLVQIGTDGLIAAIDKYVPPPEGFTKVFRGVCIGRMVGNFIDAYSETPIHFFPNDKRKLYRANKFIGRQKASDLDYDRLASEVSSGDDPAHSTTASEIADLVAAASPVSADSMVATDPEVKESVERFAAPESSRPDVQMEEEDTAAKLARAINKLTVFERKLLMLKGLDL